MSGKEYVLEGNVLVTGGAGFIGSNLTRKLVSVTSGNIIVIDNLSLKAIGGRQYGLELLNDMPKSKCKLIVGDASNFSLMKEIIKKENISIVFNLAILPLPLALKKPKYVFDKNVKIASTLAELLRREYYDTLVHFSSSEVYGSAKYVPMDENHPLEPSTAYGASKAAQDLLLLSYYITYGVDVRIIRPFNNIGPAQNDFSYSAVVPRTIKRILEGKPPEIFGDGLQTRDFIYVEDTCEAAIRMAKSSYLKGQVVNIASGRETKIKDLVAKICKIMGYTGRIVYRPPRPGDIRRHCASIAKATELLQFKPKYSLEEALAKTIDFYKDVYKKY
ncbi:MAG: GDP-mannose 4,6-dehydratase [Desulfurococcaceae archaeon]